MASYPLREQRKAATRARLIDSAARLFAENGYEETTLEQVADHAGLHVQTLYRHFANKHELATAGDKDQLASFRIAIRDPGRDDTTFEFWRGFVRKSAERVSRDGGRAYREFLLQRYSPPMVSTDLRRIGHEYEDLLSESLEKDFPVSQATLDTPRLAAIMLWGANAHVLRRHTQEEDYDLVASVVGAVDAVEAHFAHLLSR